MQKNASYQRLRERFSIVPLCELTVTDVNNDELMFKMSFAPDPEAVKKCTKGLVEKFESPIRGIDVNKFAILEFDRLFIGCFSFLNRLYFSKKTCQIAG